MCGIIGYVGTNKTADILLNSLELLEYRGYDSAGVAFCCGKNIEIYKCPGRVSELRDIVKDHGKDVRSGIGHTRWATHGSVSFKNAHPHKVGQVTLVHNGIIENYKELTRTYHLEEKLVSTGDSEVAAALLDEFYKGDPYEAIRELVEIIQGTYALVMMFEDREGEVYAIRKTSPILIAHNDKEKMLASDLMPLSKVSSDYFVLPEKAILKMSHEDIDVRSLEGNKIEVQYNRLDWKIEELDRKGYPFYMEKEIAEQGEAIRRTLTERIKKGLPDFTVDEIEDEVFEKTKQIVIVACGTSYHAGLLAGKMFEKIAHVPCRVYLASEYIYEEPLLYEDSLVLAISQSGETIDTLEALKYSKEKGNRCFAIVNVRGSSLAQAADRVMYTSAGPEIAVASTKAYTCQLTVLYLLVWRFALANGSRSKEEVRNYVDNLKMVPSAIGKMLMYRDTYHELAKQIAKEKDIYMIGRGLDYYVLLEAALKMKEISYIHTEAYASGELKHGPIALIEKDTVVISCVSQSELLSKEASNIKEVRARGAKVFAFVKESLIPDLIQKITVYPLCDLADELMVFPAITAFQLLAYYVAVEKGLNVDKPRNLAKVVTVE